jgi:dsDNA-specific endonuclease/ATPase MutS2
MTAESSDQVQASGPDRADAIPATCSSAGSPELPEKNEATARREKEQPMQEVAERIGGALGTAVRQARGVSGRVRGGLQLVQKQVADRIARAPQDASEAAAQLKETAEEKAADLKHGARRRVTATRRQIEGLKAEYPLQIILGLAAAAFVIGFGIRIWRSTRG